MGRNMDTHDIPTGSKYVDLIQAEREYPVSKRTFQRWIKAGHLPTYRPHGVRKVLLARADIDRAIEAGRVAR